MTKPCRGQPGAAWLRCSRGPLPTCCPAIGSPSSVLCAVPEPSPAFGMAGPAERQQASIVPPSCRRDADVRRRSARPQRPAWLATALLRLHAVCKWAGSRAGFQPGKLRVNDGCVLCTDELYAAARLAAIQPFVDASARTSQRGVLGNNTHQFTQASDTHLAEPKAVACSWLASQGARLQTLDARDRRARASPRRRRCADAPPSPSCARQGHGQQGGDLHRGSAGCTGAVLAGDQGRQYALRLRSASLASRSSPHLTGIA